MSELKTLLLDKEELELLGECINVLNDNVDEYGKVGPRGKILEGIGEIISSMPEEVQEIYNGIIKENEKEKERIRKICSSLKHKVTLLKAQTSS